MTDRRIYGLPLLLFALYLLTLGVRPLVLPDETRYAEISREMITTGDWVTPRFLGLRYFEKPVLGYWLNALSQQLFGQTNFAVRFASALSAGSSALLLAWLATGVSGCRRTGCAAAAIYLSSLLVFVIGIFSVLDSMLALCLSAAMVAFYWALQAPNSGQRLLRYALFGGCSGLGFLTKGLVALAVPVIAIVPFMAWQRRLPELLLWGWVAVLTAVLVAAPWALAIHSQEPDYWSYFFWEEHIKRFSADNAQHKAPFWYFVPVFFAGAMPWTLALPTALRGLRQQSPEMKTCAAYLFCWIIFPFLFFSIAKGKLGTYILPCFAPLAALLALGLTTNVGESRLSLRFAAWVNVLFAGLLAAVVTVFLTFGFKFEQVLSENEWYKSIVLTIALLIWAVLAWRARNRYGRAQEVRISAVVAFALIPAAFMLTLPLAAPGSASFSQTPEVFIADNADRINDDTLLLSDDVGLAAALAWQFSRSGVILYNSRGELSYGLSYPDASGRHVERDSFGQWLQRQRKRHAVALFLRLKRDRAPESLPAADFDVTQGRFRLVVYQRQP